MAVENKSGERNFELPDIKSLTENGLTKRLNVQKTVFGILFLLASLTIVILAMTILTMLQYSSDLYQFPDVIIEMFTETNFEPGDNFENPEYDWGILSMIWGTFYIGFISLFFAIVFGVGPAIFMSEYMPKRWARRIQPVLEFIAAIPSIILGLLAIIVLGPIIQELLFQEWFINLTAGLGLNDGKGWIVNSPFTKFGTAFMVSILAAPIVATISFDAMQSTPPVQRQAAKAFGATKHEVLLTVVLPHASKSIFAGILLGFGRVIGETMVATVVLGANPLIDFNPFVNGITITSAITIYLPEASAQSDLRDTLFFLGALLLIFSFIVVALAEAIVNNNKYVMVIVNLILAPFRYISNKVSLFLNRFKDFKELTNDQILLKLPSRRRKNLFVKFFTGFLLFSFLFVVGYFISSLFVIAFDYFYLEKTVSSFFRRIFTFVTQRFSLAKRDNYEYAIGPAIIGSISVIMVASVIAFPISTATAIYLYEFSRDNKFSNIVRQAIVNISAMPSIVVGIFVLAAFSVGLNMRQGLLPGGIALGIMMIPIVTTNSIEALRNIPESHKESALALGATRWEAFYKHRFPYAFPSIITGYVLGLARVIGETAPIFFTVAAITGTVYPTQLTDQALRMLPFEIYLTLKVITFQGPDGTRFGPTIAAAIALVLLIIVALLNFLAYFIRKKLRAKYEYNGEL